MNIRPSTPSVSDISTYLSYGYLILREDASRSRGLAFRHYRAIISKRSLTITRESDRAKGEIPPSATRLIKIPARFQAAGLPFSESPGEPAAGRNPRGRMMHRRRMNKINLPAARRGRTRDFPTWPTWLSNFRTRVDFTGETRLRHGVIASSAINSCARDAPS